MQYPNFVFRGPRARLLAASSAAALIILGLGAAVTLPHSEPAKPQPQIIHAAAPARPSPPRMLENGAPFSFADLVERVSPAVVTVTVEEQLQPSAGIDPSQLPEPFRDFFNQFGQGGQQQPRKAISMGSGFVIDKSGYIVTNNHVVENGKKITVKFPDGREFDAHLVGTDKATDIAVLKVKSDKPLPSVEFADDRQVRVGDWVIAVGNPFGLSNTVTAGIVSSIGRDIGNGPYTDFIQIDASINRGNSGGPTFDLQGKVIGMNSMIFSPSGGSVGIGFAIPSSTIREIVSQLEQHGHVSRGWLGVSIQAMTPELAASMGSKEAKGAIVASVVPGGPAAKAGLHQGDVVLAVNGKSVEDNRDLTRRVAMLAAGSSATFTINRDGQQRNVTITIGSRKEDQQVASNNGPQGVPGAEATGEAMGLGLAAVTPEVRRAYSLEGNVSGVIVTKVDPNSDAADKGIEPGDVIEQVADQAVHTPKDVQARVAAAKAQGRKSVLVLINGSRGQGFVALKIG
ncbi:MAG TPA: DegQ family serine endoprotease [Rhizomicrobium sp.]|nr:DegQ family serine endoprotease [Rhizomicrobium sp.]